MIEHNLSYVLFPICRAAAYSKLNKHVKAIEDCEKALTIDPQYSKAYGRMGYVLKWLNSVIYWF